MSGQFLSEGEIKAVERAIRDPGAVLERRLIDGLLYESISSWQSRAVLAVLSNPSNEGGARG